MSTLWVAVIISQFFCNGHEWFDMFRFLDFRKLQQKPPSTTTSRNLPTKKTSSSHFIASSGSWGGAVEEGEFLTGCSGRWNLGGMSNKKLVYAKCAKHVWHYLPIRFIDTFEATCMGNISSWIQAIFLIYVTSIKKRRIQSIPRFNISIEVIKPLWRFQHLFFWGGEGIPFIFLGFQDAKNWSKRIPPIVRVCMGECTRIFWIRFGGQQVSSM